MKITLNHKEIELSPNVKLDYLLKGNNDNWWKAIFNFLELWSNESPGIEIKTSGSTGTPKQMLIEKSKMWISATKTCEFFELNEKSTGLLCLSALYIAGQMMLVRAMVSGMNLICIEPSGNPVTEINNNIDFAAMVPMQVQQACDNDNNLNLIKNLIIGGGQVPLSLIKKLSIYKGKAYETFGMTETLSHIALKQLTPTKQNHFIPLPGISINCGYKNELIIDYPELGIYKMKTSDVIELQNNSGAFIWKGRTDFVINSGGVKISPEEVEQEIEQLITQRFCIIGLADEKLGEKVVLVIEGKSFDTEKLQTKIKETLYTYYVPKEILFINKFPITESGKIKRKKIIHYL